jgi:hypothetical protein
MTSTMRFDRWQNSLGQSYGTVLQVVSVTKTDVFSTTNTTFTDITGLSATITPKFASSKILISCQMFASTPSNNTTFYGLLRDSTDIARSTTAAVLNASAFLADIGSTHGYNIGINFLDAPNTTSSIVYKAAMRQNSGSTGFINRRSFDNGFGAISTITLMEIAQ